jgi:hypothetical protein
MINHFVEYIEKYPLSFFESFCVLIPLITGLVRFSYLNKALRVLFLYPLAYLILDMPIWYRALNRINNYIYVNLQEIIGTLILIVFFYLTVGKFSKRGLILVLTALGVTIVLGFEKEDLSTPIYIINRVTYIALSFLFFYELLEKLNVKNLLYYPEFWIVSGIIIFSCGTLFMYLFPQVTVSFHINPEIWSLFAQMNDIFKILMHIFIGIGFAVSKYTRLI